MSTTIILLLVLSLGIVETSAVEHKISQPYDGSEKITYQFISGITRVLRRKDVDTLRSLFAETFKLKTCSGTHDKYDILQMVRELPVNPDVKISYVKSEWLNSNADIKFEALVSGFKMPSFRAVFHLRRDKVIFYLTEGQVLGCPARRFFTLFN